MTISKKKQYISIFHTIDTQNTFKCYIIIGECDLFDIVESIVVIHVLSILTVKIIINNKLL